MKRHILLILLFNALFMSNCSLIRNKLTFYPDTKSKIPSDILPEYIQEKTICTPDNQRLQAFVFDHPDSFSYPLLIYFHGNAGNLYGRMRYADRLYHMGQNVLLVSYRGYAQSTGKPSEKGIYCDGLSAIRYAMDSLGYPEEKITLFGRSLGTTVAIHSAQHRNFRGVILVTPLTSGKDMATAMGLRLLSPLASGSYNSIDKLNNLKSPLLIIHGTHDKVTPLEMGRKIVETYNGQKEWVPIQGGKHNDLQDVNPALFWGRIEQFLSHGLPHTPD